MLIGFLSIPRIVWKRSYDRSDRNKANAMHIMGDSSDNRSYENPDILLVD